jgi:hypothetical protein
MLFSAFLFGTLLALPTAASAAPGDSVSGTAVVANWPHCPITSSSANIVISAQGYTGQTGAGVVTVTCRSSTQAYESAVTCLDVQGQEAVFGMTVTTSTSATFPVGTAMSLTVRDGGPGGTADGVSTLRSGSNCVHDAPNYPLIAGDILVTEGATPPASQPSSKGDCEKGGYVKYGFKNQGECVKAVQSKKH